ncbi:MAG: NAD(P)-dependent oxidoreductase [Burkholderiaceae bacterium]
MNQASPSRPPLAPGATVGLIGLGAMGRGVASNLLAKGFKVLGRDVNPEAVTWLQSQGGEAGGTPEAMGKACDIVISFVVNDAQTEDVLFGAAGLAAHLRPGTIVVACSTLSPSYVKTVAGRLAKTQVDLLDAPVSGGRAGAQKGSLTVMIGGDPAVLEAARPVLATFGGKLFHLGAEPGSGAQMKVINQLMCGVHIAVAGEAMAMASRHGLPLDTTLEILCSGAAGSWMLADRGPRMVNEGFDDVASAVDIFVKDLGLVLQAAQQIGQPTPLAQTAYDAFVKASNAGLGKKDDSAVMLTYPTGRPAEK